MNRYTLQALFSLLLALLAAGCFQTLDREAASGQEEGGIDAAPALETPEIELPDGTTTTDPCVSVVQDATTILTTNCAGCHGGGTARQGTPPFDYVLDVEKLKTARSESIADPLDAPLGFRFLRPGDPEHSRLWRRVAGHEMPPPDTTGLPPLPRPTTSDASVLHSWIKLCVPE